MNTAPRTGTFTSFDRSALGVCHLARLWQRMTTSMPMDPADWILDNIVLHGLRAPLEETYQFLFRERPSLSGFEDWIRETNYGLIDPNDVQRINAAIEKRDPPPEWAKRVAEIDAVDPVLTDEDLAFWDEHGYVIAREAIPVEQCEAAAAAVWEHVCADPNDPSTWYSARGDRGIMQQLFRHPALDANRDSRRIHRAFAQLWGTADLWTTCDRVSFNPPETPEHPFPGPRLHWDVSTSLPIPFGVQGLIYLTDTPADRGAFTCVPGFHRTIGKWMATLPKGTDPRSVNLDGISRPIAGNTGDLVIWHQALPHGSRPNTTDKPRIVQYISMFAADAKYAAEWR